MIPFRRDDHEMRRAVFSSGNIVLVASRTGAFDSIVVSSGGSGAYCRLSSSGWSGTARTRALSILLLLLLGIVTCSLGFHPIVPHSLFVVREKQRKSKSRIPHCMLLLSRTTNSRHFVVEPFRLLTVKQQHQQPLQRVSPVLCRMTTKKAGLNGLTTQAKAHDFYSLESLQERLVDFLAKHSSSCRLAVAIAGGGGHFLSTLAATPGASKVLLEGVVLYDRESYRRYVQFDYDAHHNNRHQTFRYASKESALYASHAALDKALVLTAAGDPLFGHVPLDNMQLAMGLASASALQSPNRRSTAATTTTTGGSSSNGTHHHHHHGSSRSGGSRAFVVLSKQDGPPVELQAHLAPSSSTTNDNDEEEENDSTVRRVARTRLEEDVFVSHCILTCLEYGLQYNPEQQQQQEQPQSSSRGGHSHDDPSMIVLYRERTAYGDDIVIQVPRCAPGYGCCDDQGQEDEDENEPIEEEEQQQQQHSGNVVMDAAKRILRGSHRASTSTSSSSSSGESQIPQLLSPQQQHEAPSVVLLVPSIRQHNNNVETDSTTLDSASSSSITGNGYMALHKAILPPKSLVFPGSFHPPHIGHIQLAKEALKATGCQVAWFELSLANADKPSLAPEQVVERLDGFLELAAASAASDEEPGIMPKHWGVILVRTECPV